MEVQFLLAVRRNKDMRVWIDQDLCTGDGLCAEICPDIFFMAGDGLAYVKNVDEVGNEVAPRLKMGEGLAEIPDNLLDAVVESAEECPGECIFIEAG